MNTDLSTPYSSQLSNSKYENKDLEKTSDIILQHPDGRLLNFDKLYQIMTRLQRLTLPYLDSKGNTLQIWKIEPSSLLGTVQNKQQPLKIISGDKIRLLSMKPHAPSSIIKRLEEAPLKRWDIVYNQDKLEMDLWPHFLAGGKDWYIGHIEVDKSPYKKMTKEQVIERLTGKDGEGFEYREDPKTSRGGYYNKETGARAYIDERHVGRYREPNHVDLKERDKSC